MQMNLMIRITGSFLSLISFATSVISEASITSLSVCSEKCEQEIVPENVYILSRLVEYSVIVV